MSKNQTFERIDLPFSSLTGVSSPQNTLIWIREHYTTEWGQRFYEVAIEFLNTYLFCMQNIFQEGVCEDNKFFESLDMTGFNE